MRRAKIGIGDEIIRAEMRRSGGKFDIPLGHRLERVRGGEAAGDSAGGGEGVTGGRPVRWASLFSFNALPPPDWLLVRGTLFGFAGAGAKAAAGAAGDAGVGAVVVAIWMRCVPALFLLSTLVATTIFATSAEVGRPPAAPGETVSTGLPPAGCGVDPRSMPSGSGRGGAANGGGAEIGGGGGGRAGRDEGAESSRAETNRLVRGAFGSPSKPSLVQAGSGFSVRPSNFFLSFASLKGADLRHFLALIHN
jgi:hypothetical protein